MSRVFYLLIILMLFSCKNSSEEIEVYSILHDITDPLLAQPDANRFLDAIDISNVQKTITVRYRIISDIDFNPISQLERPAKESGLFSNALSEKRKSESFVDECKVLLAEKDPIQGEAHSSIFQPVVKELRYLNSLPGNYKKRLIIYSDLRENCDWFSYYRYNDLKRLERNPDKVTKLFLEQAKDIGVSENLEVCIVFIPEHHRDNVEFKKLQNVYIDVFSELGIKISFSANLTKAELQP